MTPDSSKSTQEEYHEPERVLDLYKEKPENRKNRPVAVNKKNKRKSKTKSVLKKDNGLIDPNILDESVFKLVPSIPTFNTSKLSDIFVSTKVTETNSLKQPIKKQKTSFYKSNKLIGVMTKSPEEVAVEEEFRKALKIKEQLLSQTNIKPDFLHNNDTPFVSVGKAVLENKVFKNEKLVPTAKKNDEKEKLNKEKE